MACEPDRGVAWAQCLADAGYFADTYGLIDEPQGDSLAIVPFRLWPMQTALIWALMVERLVIILKARQLGISWLCCLYALWLCFFHPGKVVLLFSKGQLEANELARRVKVLYERLPEWMRAAGPARTTDNTTEQGWANGSRIQSLPATKSAGRSFTASLVIIDEFAFLAWPTELYTALKPTIDGGGQMIILSTANGIGNLFAELWDRAAQRLGRFRAIFLSWRARPDRTAQWRAQVAQDAVLSALVDQEYPERPEDAFVSTGAAHFLPSLALWDACREPIPPLDTRTPLVLAADAGVSGDCFALVGVSRHPDRHADIAVRLVRVWVPPPGGTLDYDQIEAEIVQLCTTLYVAQLAYDPYQLHQMMTRLLTNGTAWTDPFSQQAERLRADKALLDLVLRRGLAHDGDAQLRQAAANADRKIDAESRMIRIVKRTEALKIDPLVALSMAAYRCLELNL